MSKPKKYSVVLSGHATSVTLEPEFWEQLQTIAERRQVSVASIIAMIDATRLKRPYPANLSSEIRVFVLRTLIESRDC